MNNTIIAQVDEKADIYSKPVRTHEQIASILGINEKTVRRIEKVAMLKLAKKLAARGYGNAATA